MILLPFCNFCSSSTEILKKLKVKKMCLVFKMGCDQLTTWSFRTEILAVLDHGFG
jgi:hypothetical protein